MTRKDENGNWERAIREALNEPVEEPRPEFARAVVEGIESATAETSWLSQRLWIGAAATLAVAILTLVTLRPETSEMTSAAERIRDLAREQRLLENELEDLQQLRQSAAPVVYLAGDESLEFVYALNDPRLSREPVGSGNGYRTANR